MTTLHHLENVEREYPNIQHRFLFYPLKSLPGEFSITGMFKKDKISKLIKLGEQDSTYVISTKTNLWKETLDIIKSEGIINEKQLLIN